MNFSGYDRSNGFVTLDYEFDNPYDYEYMLDFMQGILDVDMLSWVHRVAVADGPGAMFVDFTQSVHDAGDDLRKCPETSQVNEVMAIAGNSHRLDGPVQIIMYRNTKFISLVMPEGFYDMKSKDTFDRYIERLTA